MFLKDKREGAEIGRRTSRLKHERTGGRTEDKKEGPQMML
jgi:hypothetical protein